MPGFLALLTAKLAGLGAVTKATLAAATAAVTMTMAGGAAGVIPLPGSHADSGSAAGSAIHEVTTALDAARSSLPPTTAGATSAQATGGATGTTTSTTMASAALAARTTTSQATTSTGAAGAATVAGSANAGRIPRVTVPNIPALPALPPCVANLLPTGRTVPDPTTLVTQLPTCILSVISAHLPLGAIEGAIASANFPVDLSKCLSAVVRAVPTLIGGNVSGLTQLVASCMPRGSLPGMGSIPGAGSIPGFSSIPSFSSIPGLSSIPNFGFSR